MSASREKKARQEIAGQGLTEKQLKAQQEAQKAKRNRIIYTVLGVVCAVLAAALLIWNTGFFQGRSAALTIGDENYTAADVQYYYRNVYNFYYTYAQYGFISGLDASVSPKEQTYDAESGQTWHDFFLETAVENMTQTQALVKQAQAEGYQLSEEGKQSVQSGLDDLKNSAATNGYSNINSYLKAIYGKYMNQSKYEKVLTDLMLANEFEQSYKDSLTYTDEQLETYYKENADELDIFEFNYAFFSGTPETQKDADGNTIEATEADKTAALAAAKEKAETLQSALMSGTDFNQASLQYEDDGKVTLYDKQSGTGSSLSSLYGDWLKDAARKQGDVTVVESSGSGYYVVQFQSRGRDQEITADIRHILVAAETDEGASAPTDAQYAAAKEKAETLLAQWKAGAATEDSFAELAKENSADTSSAVNGGLMTQVSSSSGYIQEFTDWALDPARKSGDTGIVQNTGSSVKGWHIMYYVQQNEELWKLNVRSTLSSEDSNAWLEGLTGALTVTRESGLKYVN